MALTFTGGVRLQQGSFKASITPIPFLVNAVNFDGTNDYLLRGGALTGLAAGKQVTFSFWVKIGLDETTMWLHDSAAGRATILKGSDNLLNITFQTSTGSTVWTGTSTNTITISSGWTHILISLNSETGGRKLYINDSLETIVSEVFNSDAIIDLVETNWSVGAHPAGILKYNGDMAEFYFTNEFIDLSIEANRRKFIDASLKPVDLGSDGSIPTGTAAIVYFNNPTVTWHTNKGTGGGYTEVGALTTATTSPSD